MKTGSHTAIAKVNTPTNIALALGEAKTQIDLIDARILLQHALKTNRAHLAAHPEQPLTQAQQDQFNTLVERRKHGEPIAYIIGNREFFGLNFKVTPAVLIPRPETEMLVDQALLRLSQHHPMRILELGTGSGAIAIAIAQHRPPAKITATDISTEALVIAKQNAENILQNRNAQIEFLHSDWFSQVPQQAFDLIVSNPPYIDECDPHLSNGDLRFEPQNALSAGPHGLLALEHITRNAASRLAPGGWLLLEHGFDQGPACRALLNQNAFTAIQTLRDLADLDRVTVGQLAIELK